MGSEVRGQDTFSLPSLVSSREGGKGGLDAASALGVFWNGWGR